jgi:hypothetical protein
MLLSQTFNFIDVLGGKQLINADNIQRFFAVRGVFEPTGSDIELIGQGRREAEIHNYFTRVAPCAGPIFAFDHAKVAELNEQVEEMDRVEEINVDGATIKYQQELINVFRNIADPFNNQIVKVEYEPNPSDMS